MKKIIIGVIAVVLVVAAYLGQVAYMGTLNQKLFELSSQPNDFVSIEDIKFEKGFFTSKASFLVYLKASEEDLFLFGGLGQMPISVEVRFKNNVFAKDNVSVDFANPLFELLKGSFEGENMIMDKIFLSVKASISLFGNVKLTSKLNDIDIQNPEFAIKSKNFTGETRVDLKGNIYGSKFAIDEFALSVQDYIRHDFAFKNVRAEEILDKGISYTEYFTQPYTSKTTGSIESVKLYDFSLTDIKSNSQTSVDKDGLIKADYTTSIKNINSPSMQVNLDDINSNFAMSNLSWAVLQNFAVASPVDYDDLQGFAAEFFRSSPKIELKNLDFSANGRKVSSKGEITGSSKEYSANFFVESEAVPGEIVPLFQFLGINELFVEKEGKYILDFAFYSDYESEKVSLNGEDLGDSGENENAPIIKEMQ